MSAEASRSIMGCRMSASSICGIVTVVGMLFWAVPARAEDPKLTFEVASVHPSVPDSRNMLRGGPGTSDPGQISWTACPLDFLIERAYGIQADQFSGPGWLSDARYDIAAKVPAGTTERQFEEMLRGLLIERFHLQVHPDTRVESAYDLLSKGPPKLKISEWVPPARPENGERFIGDVPVFSVRREEYRVVTGRGAEIPDLIRFLRITLHSGINDLTGLTGKYDFVLQYPQGTNDIIDSVRKQLGLELKTTKIALDGLVVDHVDRTPGGN